MIRLIAPCLFVLVLTGVCTAPALAAEMIEGDGFRLRVPPGFRLLPEQDCKTCPGGNIKLTGGLELEGTPQIFVALAGTDIKPEAVLLVSRMDLASGSEMHSFEDMEHWVLQNMSIAQVQSYEELMQEAGVQAREMKIGEYDALELIHDGSDSLFDDERPSTHALTVLGGDFLLVVVLMNFDGGDASTPLVWKGVTRSIRVDPPLSIIQKLGIVVVSGLALLALVLFVRRVMRPATSLGGGWVDPNGGTLSTEGWGNSASIRNAAGEPGYESIMHEAEPVAASMPPASMAQDGLPEYGGQPAAAPPGGATQYGGAPRPDSLRPNTPPTSPPSDGAAPAGLRSPLSTPPAATSRPPSQAAQPQPEADLPKRSGLVRTLPNSGRWSDKK